MEAVGPFDELSALAEGLRSGEVDLLEHLNTLQGRFESQEPTVQAFLAEADRFGRLREEAGQLVDAHPEPETRPPLFGVPVGVKDVFHVEGFPTAAGAGPPKEILQGNEAEVVSRLKRAGALILGKTVTTEFAYFAPGPTRNPHDPERTPGGSSSGSAAAVAAGLSSLTLGTQTIGSVIRPAAFCGVVGFKPSYGRVARAGLIPLAGSVDHVGFFTTDVASAELTASCLCYEWGEGEGSGAPILAVPEGPYLEHADPTGAEHFEHVCERLADHGLDVRRTEALRDFDRIREAHDVIVAGEAARTHARWFSQYEGSYHPKTLELILRGREVTDDQLSLARDRRLRLRHRLVKQMDEEGIDLWIAPAAPGAAPHGLDTTGDPIMNLPWTHSGLPVIGLPAGVDGDGLPLGVQLVGRWFEEELLLDQALHVEGALKEVQGAALLA